MKRIDVTTAPVTYDPEDPQGFRSGAFRLAPDLGAKESGVSVYEMPPGQAVCPYHYEYGEEEWAMALDGVLSVRTPEGTEDLAPNEVVFFSKGPAGAHQIRNDTDSAVRVLMFSTVVFPTATAYPGSDKVGVYTGDREEDLMVERSSEVEYFKGEGGA